jgi:hypothetical protein
MKSIPIELAFSRLGAECPDGQRSLCATAHDGSLVLVCQSSGFTRPGVGVMRYSSTLSLNPAPRARVEVLRKGLEAASSASTPVRLVILTPAAGSAPRKVHARADLIGSVTAFDGDAYSVDFVRVAEEAEPEPPSSGRRKR